MANSGRSYEPSGERQCQSGGEEGLYNELTIIALLKRRGVFVPALYATSEFSIQIAQGYYQMPKQFTRMHVERKNSHFASLATVGLFVPELAMQLPVPETLHKTANG